jgi:hypothetical protein
MRITFPGPDGQLITVADPRPSRVSQKELAAVVPVDRRPPHSVLTAFVA